MQTTMHAPLPIPDLPATLPDAARVMYHFRVVDETPTHYAVRFADRPSGVAWVPKAAVRFLGLFTRASSGVPCVLPAGVYRAARAELARVEPVRP